MGAILLDNPGPCEPHSSSNCAANSPSSRPRDCTSPSASSTPSSRPTIHVAGGAEVLNFCANNYLGLANHPRPDRAPRTRRPRPVRLRHGLGALHLRHAGRAPQALEAAHRAIPRHGRRDPLRLVLRRQRRPVRNAARRRRRGHLGRAQPRLHHRRRAPVQGAALSLRQQRHGRSRGAAQGRERRRALQAHCHRRRVFHGRHHRRT